MGELSLDGSVQGVRGVLPMALQAKEENYRGIIIPESNAKSRNPKIIPKIPKPICSAATAVICFFTSPPLAE
jgi:predicted ATPase with chaperone activity